VGSRLQEKRFSAIGKGKTTLSCKLLKTLGHRHWRAFGSAFDNQFVSIANFGLYNFISIAAATDDVLPVAFRANLAAVPEMSALFPVLGLIAAIGSTRILRRRRLNERSDAGR
jgi:hypothetical protein